MTQQKSLKRRVRARMSKTGERYTSARRQVLAKAPDQPEAVQSAPVDEALARPVDHPAAPGAPSELLMSDEAMRRGSGKAHDEWFALLDAWGATGHSHTEIAEWLRTEQGVGSWWTQSITVDYERARGMRDPHQQRDGYSISVTRTVDVEPQRALDAFTDPSSRGHWLPDAPMRQRPTRAKLTARFDWSEPPSRVVVTIVPKGAGKATVAVAHEQLRDAASAERLKSVWRDRLGELKALLEVD